MKTGWAWFWQSFLGRGKEDDNALMGAIVGLGCFVAGWFGLLVASILGYVHSLNTWAIATAIIAVCSIVIGMFCAMFDGVYGFIAIIMILSLGFVFFEGIKEIYQHEINKQHQQSEILKGVQK